MERPHFPVNTILVATYFIGYNLRYKYFKVKGHTKINSPKVIELKKDIVNTYSTPSDSETQHVLGENNEEIGEILPTRWSSKEEKYGVSIPFYNSKIRATLDAHIPGTIYKESSYY